MDAREPVAETPDLYRAFARLSDAQFEAITEHSERKWT
jgi:hypothetical protein